MALWATLIVQKRPQLIGQGGHVLQLAFPNDQRLPSMLKQGLEHFAIPLNCPSKFRKPIFGVAGWRRRFFTILVPMPKASMHEYDLFLACED